MIYLLHYIHLFSHPFPFGFCGIGDHLHYFVFYRT